MYATLPGRAGPSRLLAALGTPLFGLLGEPLGATFTPEALAGRLVAHGFVVTVDSGMDDWAQAHGRRKLGLVTLAERLIVARRA